jgi:hypothetical protein
MSADEDLVPFAVKTYRYLRIAIVVVVLALLASVLIERFHADCWQGSISAYYYTPVHAVFVGALVALGVSMIAIKGSTDAEDVLLNVAGALAPIVAFVPTSPPTDSCSSTAFVGGDVEALIDNNILALAIGCAIAIVVAYGVAALRRKTTLQRFDTASVVGLLLGTVLLVGGVVWYFASRNTFLEHAHGGAAAIMFGLIAVVIAINALGSRRLSRLGRTPPGYWIAYAALAGMMVLAAVVVGIVTLIHGAWRVQILVLETLELIPFTIFWTLQTLEHWEGGVSTGTNRAARTAALRRRP